MTSRPAHAAAAAAPSRGGPPGPPKGGGYDVLILGGGLSGLAAAVELSSRGASVALFEQAPRFGGRCYSFVDATTGDTVDNGQHVLLGAYHQALRYLSMIGTRHLLKEEPTLRLPLIHPSKGRALFELRPLPRPLDLTAGALRFRLLSWQERRSLLKVGLALARWDDALEESLALLTIDQWLESLRQSEEAKRCVWYPLALSIMNEDPRRATALLFARALKEAFLGGKASDAAILLPSVGQTELYVRNAEQFLRERNAALIPNAEVESLVVGSLAGAAGGGSGDGGGGFCEAGGGLEVTGIRVKGRGLIPAGKVISTIPYYALKRILPESCLRLAPFADLSRFRSSPIVSIHLWLDRDCMGEELYAGLIGRTVQWVFNRRKILGESRSRQQVGSSGRAGYISAVISAAHALVSAPKEELVERAIADMHAAYPESRRARLMHALVMKERRATFSATNAVERIRPQARTPVKGLLLAGDWTATQLPATIEGAVQSGFRAAELARTG